MLRQLLVGLLLCQSLAIGHQSAFAAATDAESIRSMRALALEESARGNVESSLSTFDSVIHMAERQFGKDSTFVADVCFEAGVTALKSDRYEKAKDCLAKAVRINPNSTGARLRLAEYYKIKGRYGDAKQHIYRVLQLDKRNLEAQQLLAMTYQKEGNFARATEECRILAEMASNPKLTVARRSPNMAPSPARTVPAPEPRKAEDAVVAIAAPPTPPAPPVVKPVSGLAGIRRGTAPLITEPVKVPATTPAPKAPPDPQKASTKDAKKSDSKKSDSRRADKRTEKKSKTEKRPKIKAIPVDSGIGQTAFDTPVRMQGKAVLLTPIKKAKSGSEKVATRKDDAKSVESTAKAGDSESSSEEGFGGSTTPKAASAKPVAKPAQVVLVKPRIEAPKPRRGLVPPPPPVVPTFMMAPPPAAIPPPPPRPAARPKPVERPQSEPASSVKDNEKPSDEDTDFLLDWAGKKKK